jgi:thioredoxin-related protein
MKYLFSIVFAFTVLIGSASSFSGGEKDVDCEKAGLKKILLTRLMANEVQFKEDFKTYMYCKFDSIDYQIMMGPKKDMGPALVMAFSLMMNPNGIKESITFNDLVEPIQKYKESAEYAKSREIVLGMNAIGPKKASLKTWGTDSLLLVKMNFADSNIAAIKKIVEEREDSDLDYTSVLAIYAMQNKEKETAEKETVALTVISDYEEGIAKSKETAMPALIFFASHACTNSQQMEKKVLEQLEVKKLIFFNFVFVKLMVDEKTVLPEKEQVYSKELKKKMMTVGDKNLDLEMVKFKTNAQPYFVIASPFNTEVHTFMYSSSVEDFMQFLNKGLGK